MSLGPSTMMPACQHTARSLCSIARWRACQNHCRWSRHHSNGRGCSAACHSSLGRAGMQHTISLHGSHLECVWPEYAHAHMASSERVDSGGLPWPPGTKSATKSLGFTSLVLTELFSLSIASPALGTPRLPSAKTAGCQRQSGAEPNYRQCYSLMTRSHAHVKRPY